MTSLLDPLERWASLYPDRPISRFLDLDGNVRQAYSYAEFVETTRNLAEFLLHTGLRHGDRALLVYPPGLEIAVAFFACARAGIIPVPVPPPTSANFEAALAKLRLVARDCGAIAALTTGAFHRSYGMLFASRKARRDSGPADVPLQLRWIETDDIRTPASSGSSDNPHPILFLQYTSGSTGDPKGVVVSHENVTHNAAVTIDHPPICVSWLPQYHDMGLIGSYLFPAVLGGTTYGFSPIHFLKRPALWLETMTRVQATCSSSPNFGFEYCLREDKVPLRQLREFDLRSLRILMNAAEPVRVNTQRRFLERFSECGLRKEAQIVAYGLAENTLAVSSNGRGFVAVDKCLLREGTIRIADSGADERSHRFVASCGKPLDGIEVRIVSPESGGAVTDRKIGEIWLSGKSSCRGYWERPELTHEVFGNSLAGDSVNGHSYIRTGDLGFLHQGELFVSGRIKDLIIIRGVNHYPQDIEAIAEGASAKIQPGCAAAFQGDDEEHALVIVAEVRAVGDLPDPVAIARAVRTHAQVSPGMIVLAPPRTIVKTSSGKIARQLTRQLWLDGKLAQIQSYVCAGESSPETEHSALRQRFRHIPEVFHLIGSEDFSIGEIGMDSLALVQFVLTIKELLVEKGAATLAEEIDLQLLQQLKVAEFLDFLERLEDVSEDAIAAWADVLAEAQRNYDRQVAERMRTDAAWAGGAGGIPASNQDPPRHVLLTGATGFFGPFLLTNLLRLTSCDYDVLIRAADPAHGMDRLREALFRSRLWAPWLAEALDRRVHIVCGDISRGSLGLACSQWESLTARIDAIIHNAAQVNYLMNYEQLRPPNVEGTRELLRLATSGRQKEFHHISTTFIFGWTAKERLFEHDNNAEMANLDFGYSQTKWVAEQLVLGAAKDGLPARIYRPSLISASAQGIWDCDDVALRLLAFMINHGVAVEALNQISFVPADVIAGNIARIFRQRGNQDHILHLTADRYYNMTDITRLISDKYGYAFEYYNIADFIAEMNRRCTPEDPLFPLLDFFNRSFRRIEAMQQKRYDNSGYRNAREETAGCSDLPLGATVSYLMSFLLDNGVIRPRSDTTRS